MTDESGPHKIVVGIDGSPPSVDAFRWAVRQAQVTGAVVEAVMNWQYQGALIPVGPENLTIEADAKRALDGAIRDVVVESAPPIQVTRSVEEGEAALILVDRSKDASLLVIGSRGDGAFVGMLIGSVSQYCVSHAHCPVVVLRGHEG